MPCECMVTKTALKVPVIGVAFFVLGVGETYGFRTLLLGLSTFPYIVLKGGVFEV